MDPLAQLHDIQTPEQIGQFPLAMGWYILMALILLLVIFGVRYVIKRKKLKQKQQQALASLSSADSTQAVISVLKWAALAYFPRQQVAQLHSEAFFNYLMTKIPVAKQSHFKALGAESFNNLYQQTQSDVTLLKSAANYWLKNALPVKGAKHV